MKTFSSLQDLGKQSLQIFAGMRKDKRAEKGGNQMQGQNNPIPCLTMSFLLVLVPTDRQRGKTTEGWAPIELVCRRVPWRSLIWGKPAGTP